MGLFFLGGGGGKAVGFCKPLASWIAFQPPKNQLKNVFTAVRYKVLWIREIRLKLGMISFERLHNMNKRALPTEILFYKHPIQLNR